MNKMIGEFFKPDKKRIGLFAILMAILIGGSAHLLHLQGDITLPDNIFQLLEFLHMADSLFFLCSPIVMFSNYVGVSPFYIAIKTAYLYILSSFAASLWENRSAKELKEILTPSKTKIPLFLLLAAVIYIATTQDIGVWPANYIVKGIFPASFNPLSGTIFIITLPAYYLFDYFLAGIVLFVSNEPSLLLNFESVYTLLILLNLYVFCGIAVYIWNNRKNRTVVKLAALCLVFIFAMPLLLQHNSENEPEIPGDSDTCISNDTGQLLLKCGLFADDAERIYCLSKVALERGCNIVCDSIKDIDLKESCEMGVAQATKNASICEGFRPNYLDICYSEVGLASKNLFVCEKINVSDIRDKCYSDVAIYRRDTSLCDKTKMPGERDWCVERIAVAKKDPSMCAELKNGGNMSYYGQPNATFATRDLCFGATAEVTKNVSLCGEIDPTDLNMINQCYEWVGIAKEDPLICAKIKEETIKDRCYSGIAESKKDISDCESVVKDENKNACYLAAAKSAKNLSMCEKIPLAYLKDVCYSAVGVELKDASVCGRIDSPYPKDTCYSGIAKKTNSLDLCKKVIDSDNRDTCYIEIGL